VDFTFRPLLRAMTPAMSNEFCVKSKWRRLVDSGRNSASMMAPSAVREVADKNSRLSAVFSVKAVLSDVIYPRVLVLKPQLNQLNGNTPSTPGPQQGFRLMSSVSSDVLYFWNNKTDQ
jgi:hypothetical protein